MTALARLLVVGGVVGATLALGVVAGEQAGARPTFGAQPLADVRHAAADAARCGLTANQLTALVLAPTYPETGSPAGVAPSPATLSRWDDQLGLHSFGTRRGERSAFWHPGVGAWQFDSAGLGAPFGAAQAIDTYVVAARAARTIADRWCRQPTLAYVWAPWFGCGAGDCRRTYRTIYRRDGDRLVNLDRDPSVHRHGGAQRRRCTGVTRPGEFTCWRVDPARAQGHDAFAAPGYGPSPISAPFYVYLADGREYRHWRRVDTGYRRGIWASRPLGADARTSLTWHRGDGLTDVTARRRPDAG